MARPIHQRSDVDPHEGATKYGDVEFADPVNKKYPVDSAAHVRAAWSYINQARNAEKYRDDEVERIRTRIKAAAKRFDVDITD